MKLVREKLKLINVIVDHAQYDGVWEIPKVAQLIGTCSYSLDEGDSPSKFRASAPALLYKVLPQSYQDGQYINYYVWLLYEFVLLEID